MANGGGGGDGDDCGGGAVVSSTNNLYVCGGGGGGGEHIRKVIERARALVAYNTLAMAKVRARSYTHEEQRKSARIHVYVKPYVKTLSYMEKIIYIYV